jgi:3-methylcrotonyl-CoA carboxylase alpha subunit
MGSVAAHHRVALVKSGERGAVRIGPGMYRVEHEGRSEIIYVAGSPGEAWAFWNGRIFRSGMNEEPPHRGRSAQRAAALSLAAPMPATVLKVLVTAGSLVKQGDTVIILEAMKMELPVRTSRDGIVTAVHCREGELVQPDTVLVEIADAVR